MSISHHSPRTSSRLFRLGTLLVAIAIGASSCSSYLTGSASRVATTGVKVTPQTVQIAAIGGTAQLVASVAPAGASDRAVTWESTSPSIASVDSLGLVTALAAGTGVFITAITHDGRFQSSANVSVVP